MRIRGLHYRTIWPAETQDAVEIIDQTALPHRFDVLKLKTLAEMVQAIKTMQVRGAPLIGAAAAYGMALALREQADDDRLRQAGRILAGSRPTAVNLRWAVERMEQFAHLVQRETRDL